MDKFETNSEVVADEAPGDTPWGSQIDGHDW